MKRIALALLLALLIAPAAGAKNIDLVTLPDRDSVQLTIYNSEDLTLVKETRSVTLKKGDNKLQFSWAGLAARRLDAARIGDLRLVGRIDSTGLRLGALDALRSDAPGSGAGASVLPVLPVGRLEIERAVVYMANAGGAKFEQPKAPEAAASAPAEAPKQ